VCYIFFVVFYTCFTKFLFAQDDNINCIKNEKIKRRVEKLTCYKSQTISETNNKTPRVSNNKNLVSCKTLVENLAQMTYDSKTLSASGYNYKWKAINRNNPYGKLPPNLFASAGALTSNNIDQYKLGIGLQAITVYDAIKKLANDNLDDKINGVKRKFSPKVLEAANPEAVRYSIEGITIKNIENYITEEVTGVAQQYFTGKPADKSADLVKDMKKSLQYYFGVTQAKNIMKQYTKAAAMKPEILIKMFKTTVSGMVTKARTSGTYATFLADNSIDIFSSYQDFKQYESSAIGDDFAIMNSPEIFLHFATNTNFNNAKGGLCEKYYENFCSYYEYFVCNENDLNTKPGGRLWQFINDYKEHMLRLVKEEKSEAEATKARSIAMEKVQDAHVAHKIDTNGEYKVKALNYLNTNAKPYRAPIPLARPPGLGVSK
jgi:hypothetical protein